MLGHCVASLSPKILAGICLLGKGAWLRERAMKPECIRCGSELVHCFHHTFSFFKKVIRLTQIQEVENRLHLLPGGTDFTDFTGAILNVCY